MIKYAMQLFLSTIGVYGIILLATPPSHAVPANPCAFHTTQPGGKIITPQLLIQGDEHFSFITDRKGFTVMKDENDWIVYARIAQRQTAEGSFNCLAPTSFRVGMIGQFNETFLSRKKDMYAPPEQIPKLLVQEAKILKHCAPLQGKLLPNQTGNALTAYHPTSINALFSAEAAGHRTENATRRSLENPLIRKKLTRGTLKQLVVLIRFADHINRTLPEPNEYDIMLNQRGGDSVLAPSGSVRDVFLEISYNQLSVESVVYNGWITLSKTEEYYADLAMGTGTKFNEAVSEAMDIIDRDESFSLSHFDKDEDDIIDVITFFHSGYGAENGGRDCETNAEIANRVWSHFHGDRGISWCSKNARNGELCVDPYIVATGLWGTCSSIICRIGTVSHEIGHFLGLKDMYDGNGLGSGVGCYSIMASVWGFDISQRHPVSLLSCSV
jgi:M6 family metalloprotease-like protein